MEVRETLIPGCMHILPRQHSDARGSLVKTFHADVFAEHGLTTSYREEFVSTSVRGVLRGMHFQVPPAEHAKLVTCLEGTILDVAVDLRRGSPTYGEHHAIEMDGSTPSSVYLPAGLAHGFLVVSDQATVSYLVSSVHAPDLDAGIRWDSFGYSWPVDAPLVSQRDAEHPPLEAFETPFEYTP